jgi:hypothetical protein
MSLWRWLRDPEINFPQPALRVRERRYWLEEQLVAWERSQRARAARSAQTTRRITRRNRRTEK